MRKKTLFFVPLGTIHYMIFIYSTLVCITIISLTIFSYFKHFDFPGCRRVKVQKRVQNYKKICLSRFISHEPHIIWLSFVVHKCKMIISPRSFSIFFKILIFQVVRRVKVQKMARNDKKLCQSCLYISGNTHYMNFSYGTNV